MSSERNGGGGSAMVAGRNPVLEVLRSGRPVRLLLVARGGRRGAVREILRLAAAAGIPIEEVAREELDLRAGEVAHQGIVALVEPRRPSSLEEILERARRRGEDALVVVAAEVQDPRNLGSLIRSAEAAGAHGILLPRHRSASLTAVAVKASAGAAEHLPVATVTNVARCLEDLKERGFWVYGADAGGDALYHDVDWRGRVALVVGGEGRGMPRLVRERCDVLVRIPMRGVVSSLNVAVAGAVMLFEAARQRSGTRKSVN